jgi:hypothetical protein
VANIVNYLIIPKMDILKIGLRYVTI